MVGRATLTMKKSTRGRAAASSTANSPSPPSTGAGAAGERTEREVRDSVVTVMSLLPHTGWYQSVLILVATPPGNRVRAAAGWRV